MRQGNEALSKGDIIVEDDVWIGQGATIMSGVHIGQGAVIGAGSIVNKDIEAYSVVAGVPAKLIKMRFPPNIITKLLEIDYSNLTDEMIKTHIKELYSNLNNINEQEIEKILGWLPKKKLNVILK